MLYLCNIMADFVNIHTHKAGEGINVLDISDGKMFLSGVLCSAGVHPLYAGKGMSVEEVRLKAEQGNIVAVGEAGLDRNAELPLEQQIILFEQQAGLSEHFGLPMIIHCVRAFSELIAVHKKMRPKQTWIIHGYNNNAEILQEVLKHRLFVSIGKALMNERSNAWKLLPEIPVGQLFLETDDSDYTIGEIYRQAAFRRGVPMEGLKTELYDNFEHIFIKRS